MLSWFWCDVAADIDLCDEGGNLKNLRDFPNKYAAELLEDRERLVLIRIDRKYSSLERLIRIDGEYFTEND